MKNTFILLLISLLTIAMLNSCANQKSQTVTIPKGYQNTRTVRTANSGSNVTCRNCRAKFKLSDRIQKLVHSGHAEVRCPECHKNYLTGQVVK